MKAFENACRLAQVIFNQGYSYLSLSEEICMEKNEDFGSAVRNIVDIYEQLVKLQNKKEFSESLELLPLETVLCWVWDCQNMKFRAILYQEARTKIALLEIREYTPQNWYDPFAGSTHHIILQKGLKGNETEKWIDECVRVVKVYGFTNENGYTLK